MDGDGTCPGPCNSGYRKARALWDDATEKHGAALARLRPGEQAADAPAPPDIVPWYGEPVWCRKCQATIRAELAELDDLAALIITIQPLARAGEDNSAGRVKETRVARSPSARMDDVEELDEWLRSWEAIARRGGETFARRGVLATEVTTIIAWLVSHLDPILASDDYGLDFGTEVRKWHREMCRRAAAGRMQRHQKKPCPRCALYTLWLVVGEDYIRCCNEDCGRALSREEYDGLASAA